MATHSSILAWEIPWSEFDELQSMGSQRIGHNSACTHSTYICRCVYVGVYDILKEKKIFWCSKSLNSDSPLFIYYPQDINSGLPRKTQISKWTWRRKCITKTHTKQPYLNSGYCFHESAFYWYLFSLDSIRYVACNFEAILHFMRLSFTQTINRM